jgi:hypothetical protein
MMPRTGLQSPLGAGTQQAFGIIHRPGKLVEVRAIYRHDEPPWIGTFRDTKLLFEAVADANSMPEIARIQWSINTPRSDWRVGNFLERGKSALCKADIAQRDWAFLDFDRAPGASAMDEYDMAHVLRYLAEFGIPEPLLISSGRGLNSLWRAGWSIEAEPDFHVLCRGLADKFNDEYITVDDATSPERGAKIPGTQARKTDDPAAWKPVSILNLNVTTPAVPQSAWQAVIDALRADGHVKNLVRPSNGFGAPVAEGFDIYDFCEAYGIEILAEHGDRFDVACPLKGERHSGSVSVTSLFYDGDRLGFKCLHPDHEDVTIGKLVSTLQAEQGTYQLPLFAERESGIEVEDVGDDFMKEEKPWNE